MWGGGRAALRCAAVCDGSEGGEQGLGWLQWGHAGWPSCHHELGVPVCCRLSQNTWTGKIANVGTLYDKKCEKESKGEREVWHTDLSPVSTHAFHAHQETDPPCLNVLKTCSDPIMF